MRPQTPNKKRSTPQELNDFLHSNVYKDFSDVLEARICAVQNDLCMAENMEQVRRLQGELLGLKFWELFPRSITEAILEESDNATTTDD